MARNHIHFAKKNTKYIFAKCTGIYLLDVDNANGIKFMNLKMK